MQIIRPATLKDLDGIERCALTSGPGLTHLPRNRGTLERLVRISLDSFAKEVADPFDEQYLFVLEDLETKKIGGTCGIYSRSGVTSPFYVYKIATYTPPSNYLPPPNEPRVLELYPYVNGPSEVCALYLLPDYRHGGLGKLVSLSRFLFIASHSHRFTKTIIANMRGVIENGVSLFWNSIGRHFLDVDLQEVMTMRMNDEHLLSDIFPRSPIYVTLLSPHAQRIIGQVHAHTKPALGMLQKEGFQFANEIDPVDGGPIIQVEAQKVRTIEQSIVAQVSEIVHHNVESERFLIANLRVDFRACLGPIAALPNQKVILSEEVAAALEVKRGDSIRYIPCPQTSSS